MKNARIRQSTDVLLALLVTYMAYDGLAAYRAGAPIEQWLLPVTVGALVLTIYVPILYLRLINGVALDEPAPWMVVPVAVASLGVLLVGAWSFTSGHRIVTWGVLVGVGAFGLFGATWGYVRTVRYRAAA